MMEPEDSPVIHAIWIRAYHWVNAIAILIMTFSGWRIYNASPLWDFRFPSDWTLGGWLGGALQWHFAFMWVLVANTALYLLVNVFSGRLWSRFFLISPVEFIDNVKAVLTGRLAHNDLSRYNAVQRFAYVFVIVDLILIVLSGLVMWKSVQFPVLRELLGGYEAARRIHFICMAGLVAFFVVHVSMALMVPKTIVAMVRGR